MANTFELEFGGQTAVAEVTGVRVPNAGAKRQSGATGTDTSQAPPNATAAPTKGASNIFTGLCDALNQHQQDLVKKKTYEIADQYAIEFASSAIAGAQVVKPGPVTYKNTAAKDTNTAQAKLDNKTDQVNVNSQEWNLVAGTQIVQFIDQVMRSSRYITDQQTGNYNEDGKWVPNKTANTKGVTAWYKISVSAKQLGYDKKRRDNAYRMTFIISPYAINQMDSEYFPNSTYRGAHKAFNYWFTGLNTQILSYEQEYNSAYYTTMTGNATGLATPPPTGRDQRKRTYLATSEQRGQGQANYVNEPADSAAAFLYSVSDFAQVNMKIVGDPAWMQQGEASTGVNAQTFDYKPFNPDGTINFDSQEVTFTVSFNRPTDYDFSTGIMNVNASSGAPKETFAYIATSCKNVFSKGQFTQELSGSLLPLDSNPNTSANANGRPPINPNTSANGQSPTTASDSRTTSTPNDGSLGSEVVDETGQVSNLRRNEYGDLYDPAGTAGSALPSPRPAPPPQPATSTGELQNTPSTEFGFEVASTPQEMNRDT
jgi:hypothetical protein